MEKDYLLLKRASASRPSGEWNDDELRRAGGNERKSPRQPAATGRANRKDRCMMKRLACAGALLALGSVDADAQQQQQQPQRECFTVAMNNQANVGSILLDKCTGKTWVLLSFSAGDRGSELRWRPITVEEPAGR
jgi:hypothetical protein